MKIRVRDLDHEIFVIKVYYEPYAYVCVYLSYTLHDSIASRE